MILEYVDVAECGALDTGGRTAVVQGLVNIGSTLPENGEPAPRYRIELLRFAGQPLVDLRQIGCRIGKEK